MGKLSGMGKVRLENAAVLKAKEMDNALKRMRYMVNPKDSNVFVPVPKKRSEVASRNKRAPIKASPGKSSVVSDPHSMTWRQSAYDTVIEKRGNILKSVLWKRNDMKSDVPARIFKFDRWSQKQVDVMTLLP